MVHGGQALICAIDRQVVAEARIQESGTLSISSEIESADLPLDIRTESVYAPLRLFHHVARALGCAGAALSIRSEIPAGAGLGSSSACCVAAAGSLSALYDTDIDIMDVAVAAEKSIYPNSSGADCAACIRGGIISYTRGAPPSEVATGQISSDLRLVIADSKITRHTKDMVERVRRMAQADPSGFSKLKSRAAAITDGALEALSDKSVSRLGCLATENQTLLESLGISNDVLGHMIRVANHHSYGAKITGAGGGGCIVAVADESNYEATVNALASEGYGTFQAKIGAGGRLVNTL